MSAHVLLNLLNEMRKGIKCEACLAFYFFFATSLINSIKQEYEYKCKPRILSLSSTRLINSIIQGYEYKCTLWTVWMRRLVCALVVCIQNSQEPIFEITELYIRMGKVREHLG